MNELGHRMGWKPNGTPFKYCHSVMKSIFKDKVGEIQNTSGISVRDTRFNNSGVIIMSGMDTAKDLAHAWVVDGCDYICIHEKIFVYTYDKDSGRLLSKELKSDTILEHHYYYHINWGWGGDCNGYFHNILFKPNQAAEYDFPYGNNTDDDNKNYSYVIQQFIVTK